jgi:hypothetical protein
MHIPNRTIVGRTVEKGKGGVKRRKEGRQEERRGDRKKEGAKGRKEG